jgi:hypothetical protein
LVECPVVERVPALREVLQRTVVHALGAVGLGDHDLLRPLNDHPTSHKDRRPPDER